MNCSKCGGTDFVEIIKKPSKKEEKLEQIVKIVVCKNCDPLLASLSKIKDGGYEIAISLLTKQNDDSE